MSNLSDFPDRNSKHRIRVVFFGMRCAFSIPPLQALMRSGIDVAAVVVSGMRGAPLTKRSSESPRKVIQLPRHGIPPSIDGVAAEAAIPVYSAGSMRDPMVEKLIHDAAPDVIAVACFPWLIPASIRSIPKSGCLNLHPSLLPRWRGPEPLLWTLLSGDAETGATIHLMDDGYDTGPILLQRQIPVPEGVSGHSLEWELAELGGDLLVEAIRLHVIGETKPINQDESQATFAPSPGASDLMLSTDKTALELFKIIRAVVPIVGEIRVRIVSSGEEVTVKQAIEFNMHDSLVFPVLRSGETTKIQCRAGVLTVTLM